MATGRPRKYDRGKLIPQILAEISGGESLAAVCRKDGYPSLPTFLGWVAEDTGDLPDRYARAMAARADLLFDELLEIADDGQNDWMETHDEDNPGYKLNGEHVQRSRLRIDARKWALAKMHPQKYGDHKTVDQNVSGGLTVKVVDKFSPDSE